jgi:hypothetical protein
MAGEFHQIDYDHKAPQAKQWEKLNFTLRRIFAMLDQKQTGDAESGGGTGGTMDHAALTHLGYSVSGHTGFAPTAHTHPGEDAFPVGSVFIAAVSTDPNILLGYGTWSFLGVGVIDLLL